MKEISFLLFSNSCVKVQRSSLREVWGTWGEAEGRGEQSLWGGYDPVEGSACLHAQSVTLMSLLAPFASM